jgi:putative ABC transport system substrate-binding protein
MRRRDILAVLAGVTVPLPLLVLGQPLGPVKIVGVLMGVVEGDPEVAPRVAIFKQALQELGWTEGRNVRIHYRWAVDADRMRTVAKELIAPQPDVIVASSSFVVDALLRETRVTPIVFVSAADPVGDGFVASLGRPGGNATGFANNLASIGGKLLELLKEIAPATINIAVMFDPEPGGGLVVMPDNFTFVHRGPIVELAARHQVPAIYPSRDFATGGGLMSYGADLLDLYRRVPSYVDRILKGAKPADLPVQSADKIELVINLNVAKRLGLTVPRLMLARAHEVIE